MLHGIDISKSKFDVASHDTNSKIKSTSFKYDSAGMSTFIVSLPVQSHLVMEYTGNYELRLAHELLNAGHKVSIVSGATIRQFANMKKISNKTDKQDAKSILLYAEKFEAELPIYKVCEPEIAKIKQLRSLLEDLAKRKQMAVNQRDSHLLIPNAYEKVTESYDRQVESLTEEIADVEKEIAAIRTDEIKFDRAIPMSVTGIGPKTTAELEMLMLTATDITIENVSKIVKLVGLAPSVHQSGSSVRGAAKVSRGGYASLRKSLYMCAMRTATHKKEDNPFKDFYLSLRSEGKCFKKAIVAVMAKMLRVTLTLIIKGEKYSIEKHRLASAK